MRVWHKIRLLPLPWASGSKNYRSELSNEVLKGFIPHKGRFCIFLSQNCLIWFHMFSFTLKIEYWSSFLCNLEKKFRCLKLDSNLWQLKTNEKKSFWFHWDSNPRRLKKTHSLSDTLSTQPLRLYNKSEVITEFGIGSWIFWRLFILVLELIGRQPA